MRARTVVLALAGFLALLGALPLLMLYLAWATDGAWRGALLVLGLLGLPFGLLMLRFAWAMMKAKPVRVVMGGPSEPGSGHNQGGPARRDDPRQRAVGGNTVDVDADFSDEADR